MADLNDIASALEHMGATVDRSQFATRMTDPKYAESVRQALSSGGADVSDSTTFYNTYGKPNQSSTTPAANPVSDEDLQDLYTNAKEVGYIGLDSDQQALFRQQFPYSKAAADGMTLADAIKATDAGANTSPVGRVINKVLDSPIAIARGAAAGLGSTVDGIINGNNLDQIASNAIQARDKATMDELNRAGSGGITAVPAAYYQAARDVLAKGIGGLDLLGGGAVNTAWDAINGQGFSPLSGLADQIKPSQQVEQEASKGQGLPGVLANPINFVPMADVGTLSNIVSKVPLSFAPKVASYLGNMAGLGRVAADAAVGAGENAGLAETNNIIEPKNNASVPLAAITGAAGNALSNIPTSILAGAIPGVNKAIASNPKDKERILKAATDMYNNVSFPYMRGSYENVADEAGSNATKLYDNLMKETNPYGIEGLDNPTNISGYSQPAPKPGEDDPVPSVDMKSFMMDFVRDQNRQSKAGFTDKQIEKAVNNTLDRMWAAANPEYKSTISAIHGDPGYVNSLEDVKGNTDLINPAYYAVGPQPIFDARKFLNEDIYNTRGDPKLADKAKMAQMLHDAVNSRISNMTVSGGDIAEKKLAEASKAYADYMEKQKILNRGISSGYSGNKVMVGPFEIALNRQYFAPTALGRGINLAGSILPKLGRQ